MKLLLALLPFASLLALLYYLSSRAPKRAKEELAKLVADGFSPDAIFDLSDAFVCLDLKSQRITFVHIPLTIRPREFGIDRDSYTSPFTITEPFSKLEGLDVWIDGAYVSITVHFNAPCTFDRKMKICFDTSPSKGLNALVASWPGASKPSVVRKGP